MSIIAVVLLTEGFSVFLLFSYAGFGIGIVSILLGALLLASLYRPDSEREEIATDPTGIRLVTSFIRFVGGDVSIVALGLMIVIAVYAYNSCVSPNPDIGDADTLTVLLGIVFVAYPFVQSRFRTEAAFTLIFCAFVVILLVVPQVLLSVTSGAGVQGVGNWYVHYMLAAPFSHILDLIGIQSVSSGNLVTIEFQDGSVHTLAISAYCAGLYSFSIFLAAFIAFVLTFEKMSRRLVIFVLGLGLLVAYMGNLFRMVVIGVVGYYRGLDALHWTHENVGWIIFLVWSSLFWWLILSRAPRREDKAVESPACYVEFLGDEQEE